MHPNADKIVTCSVAICEVLNSSQRNSQSLVAQGSAVYLSLISNPYKISSNSCQLHQFITQRKVLRLGFLVSVVRSQRLVDTMFKFQPASPSSCQNSLVRVNLVVVFCLLEWHGIIIEESHQLPNKFLQVDRRRNMIA
jgi:hypothetical protein